MALEERKAQSAGGLGDLAALLGMFTGKEQTTQTKLSQTAMNQMLQSAFEKNGGLSAVSSGQRGSGMYNSSTNQLLTNDLISRLTAETAQRGAPTTVSSPAAIDPLMGLAGLGILQMMSKGKKGEAAAGAVTASAPTSAAAVTGESGNMVSNFLTNPLDSIGSLISDGFSGISGALGFGGGAETPQFQPTSINAINAANVGNIDALMSAANFYGTDALSQQTKQLIGQDFFGEGVGTDMGLGSVPWTAGLGNLAAGDLEGAIGSVGKSWLGSQFGGAMAAAMGIPVVGPIVGALAGLSVICTELHRQGYLPQIVYEAETTYANKMISAQTYWGYRMWADWVVSKMQKSHRVTRFVSWFALPYIYRCAHKVNPKIKHSWRGTVVAMIGTPICWMLGHTAIGRTLNG